MNGQPIDADFSSWAEVTLQRLLADDNVPEEIRTAAQKELSGRDSGDEEAGLEKEIAASFGDGKKSPLVKAAEKRAAEFAETGR